MERVKNLSLSETQLRLVLQAVKDLHENLYVTGFREVQPERDGTQEQYEQLIAYLTVKRST